MKHSRVVHERNSGELTDPAMIEWAGRVPIDQIPGVLLFLTARWLSEIAAIAARSCAAVPALEKRSLAPAIRLASLAESRVRLCPRLRALA